MHREDTTVPKYYPRLLWIETAHVRCSVCASELDDDDRIDGSHDSICLACRVSLANVLVRVRASIERES